jgi:hypothetical protein
MPPLLQTMTQKSEMLKAAGSYTTINLIYSGQPYEATY